MSTSMPRLETLNGRKALFVDDKPFIMLGLQWNCEYCYTPEVLDPPFAAAKRMGLNTASLLVYWDEIEPEPDKYSFAMLDHRIEMCRKNDMKMILVWFASYKNGCMNYAPRYVKEDHETYRKAMDAKGQTLVNFCCPTAEETHRRDEKALRAMMEHIRQVDGEEHTVVLIQMENETGLLGTDRCYCPVCNEKFAAEGYAAKYGKRAAEAFSAASIARYCDSLAGAAKEVYPLPVYMNAWLPTRARKSRPGEDYPSGGPVESVFDVYRDTLRHVDFIAPDIYQYSYHDFRYFCDSYSFEGNPLFIAECATGRDARTELNMVYALGEYAAIGFDPWAIDCNCPDFNGEPLYHPSDGRLSDFAHQLMNSYKIVNEAMLPIAYAQNTDRMRFFVEEPGESGKLLRFDDDTCCEIAYESSWGIARGFVIRLSENEFLLPCCYTGVRFTDGDGVGISMKIDKGYYDGMDWRATVHLAREGHDFSSLAFMREAGVLKVTLER